MNTIKKYFELIRHYSLPGTRLLQQELDTVREVHAAVSAELVTVLEDRQRMHEDDEGLLADLRHQLKRVKSERSLAQFHIEALERSLGQIGHRQKIAQAHIASLEAKLGEERNRHESTLRVTETRQLQMQAEQQSLLIQQAGLVDNVHSVSKHLLEFVEKCKSKPRYSLPQLMTLASVLFITGTLAGIVSMQTLQDDDQTLAQVERDIRDMHVYMKRHIEYQDALIKEVTLALKNQFAYEQALLMEKPSGPEILQPETDNQQAGEAFTVNILELQANLIALGFDLGRIPPSGKLDNRTRQALQEFRQFYLPQSDTPADEVSEPLVEMILKSAEIARIDAARFSLGSGVLAAIRLGSIRTGLDFPFLMELARIESDFNPAARAPNSSATGLYQFKDSAWLEAIRAYGSAYGLKDDARHVNLIEDEEHELPPVKRDPLQRKMLALRLNPRLSTLLAAENIKRNQHKLSQVTGRKLGRTDLYLPHFFGATGARLFLKALEEKPASMASELFPEAAARNKGVFHNGQHESRSVAEVYAWIDRKFNTARYDESSTD